MRMLNANSEFQEGLNKLAKKSQQAGPWAWICCTVLPSYNVVSSGFTLPTVFLFSILCQHPILQRNATLFDL